MTLISFLPLSGPLERRLSRALGTGTCHEALEWLPREPERVEISADMGKGLALPIAPWGEWRAWATPLGLEGPHGFGPGLLAQCVWWKGAVGGLCPTHQPPAMPCHFPQVAHRVAGTLIRPPHSCRDGCADVSSSLDAGRGFSSHFQGAPSSPCPALPQGTAGPQDILTEMPSSMCSV